MRAVTYGPFPKEKEPNPAQELGEIAAAGFNTLRLYTLPEKAFLDAAHHAGLQVFAGLDWWQHADFLAQPRAISSARTKLAGWLKTHAAHPAVSGVYVGNEIPSDLVRWMGPLAVRREIEVLIELGRITAPDLLFAYANYPSTEYLEPGNADFSAFNIYLENPDAFSAYLQRLQNIAGDRPLVVSEFGMDSARNGLEKQAENLLWALQISLREEAAGLTIYSWTDLWESGGKEVLDWDFGLTDRDGNAKPALSVVADFHADPPPSPQNKYSVIICTRNGCDQIGAGLTAIAKLSGGPHETIVVSDGSTDGTAEFVAENFPWVRVFDIPPSGLSVARNLGASEASGNIIAFTDDDCEPDPEWLVRIDRAFLDPAISAAGGPNLPPPPRDITEAVIRAAPGAPSHVLLTDTEAEHLPGCNIIVRKTAFEEIGGFDPRFRTAGDDVDFCWRLSDAGHRMAFVPGAFVWHWRRPSIRTFLKQQMGYGKAEKLLLKKHPSRFGANGEARWAGFVYGGGAIRAASDSIIYHGSMGQAGYQAIMNRMLPLRPIDTAFKNWQANFLLGVAEKLQPLARRWARTNRPPIPRFHLIRPTKTESPTEFSFPNTDGKTREAFLEAFLENGWQAGGDTDSWDISKNGTRILIATEIHSGGYTSNLFRIWGDPADALAVIQLANQPSAS